MAESEVLQLLIKTNRDMGWYKQNLSLLKEKYLNQFIAIGNSSVVEADPELEGLLKKLHQKGIERSSVLVKFITNLRAILA
ncbi:hypothetical protein HYV84_02640 [Candidatus Woesearchaeota archaeon]|nr:hypothetical protein [Candidatus Woesearchaeota archaeon]